MLTPKLKNELVKIVLLFSVVGNMYQFVTYSNKVSIETTKEIETITNDRDIYQKSYYEVTNENLVLRKQLTDLKEEIIKSTLKESKSEEATKLKKDIVKHKHVKEKVITVPFYEVMQ